MKNKADDSRKKMTDEQKRNTRTNCTAILMDTNVQKGMTVHIVCGQKRDTNHAPQRRIQWEVVCYTNEYHIVHDGVGREKRIAKPVSFKKILKLTKNRKKEIKYPLKSILLWSRHHNQNKKGGIRHRCRLWLVL